MLYALAFAGGFAACWFAKDTLKKLFLGAETFAAFLRDKATALEQSIRTKL